MKQHREIPASVRRFLWMVGKGGCELSLLYQGMMFLIDRSPGGPRSRSALVGGGSANMANEQKKRTKEGTKETIARLRGEGWTGLRAFHCPYTGAQEIIAFHPSVTPGCVSDPLLWGVVL